MPRKPTQTYQSDRAEQRLSAGQSPNFLTSPCFAHHFFNCRPSHSRAPNPRRPCLNSKGTALIIRITEKTGPVVDTVYACASNAGPQNLARHAEKMAELLMTENGGLLRERGAL